MPASSRANLKLSSLVLAVQTALFMSVSAQAANESSTDLEKQLGYEPNTTLEKIVVVAESEKADGPVQGIAASTTSALGYDESILESTQSVSVVGQKEINTIGAESLDEALGYTTGYNRAEPNDKTFTSNIIRGFRNLNINRDGQKYQINIFDGQQEIYGLERIEVLKGASSIVSGDIAPGGVVNAITKEPHFFNTYEVNAEVGSYNHKKVSTDINQKLNDELAVRLVGVHQDSDTFIDYVPDNNTYIAPSLTWLPTDDTKVTLKADYRKAQTKYVFALPLEGTLLDSPNGKIDRETFTGIPGFSDYDSERYTLGYEVKHNITPDLEITHNLRKMKVDVYFPEVRLRNPVDAQKEVYSRYVTKRQDASEVINSSVSAKYDWSANQSIDNSTLFGVDYYDGYHDTERYFGGASNINLFNPDHTQDTVAETFAPLPSASWVDDIKEIGVYVQNKLTYNDKLVVSAGLRHDMIDAEKTGFFEPKDKQTGEYSATTGRAGIVYLLDNDFAPYASYSQSFEVELGEDRAGNNFEPTEGEQYEFGVRYQPQGSDTLLTGSVYRIVQSNVLVDDPKNKDRERYKVQLGEVRSQGLELEAKTQLGENANLIAGYAYTDARTIKASPLYPDEEGQRTGNVPYNAFSLWGDYRFADFGMPKLKAGLGVRFTGETKARSFDEYAPEYTLVDMMASYDWSDNLNLSLHAKNLLDEEYVHCTYGCFYGEPRNVVGKISYKW